jgi:8-oxo-dGTP pyrophosphatase MutT (NUDIX family)
MAHIHTMPGQHDTTVTLYIVRHFGKEWKALLHMHRKLQRLLPVGGHVELHETPWQAAVHELREEAGYEMGDLQILQPKVRMKSLSGIALHPAPVQSNTHDITDNHFHTDLTYALIASSEPTITIAANESHDARWLSRQAIEQLGANEIYQNSRETYLFVLDTLLEHWEAVPTTTFAGTT